MPFLCTFHTYSIHIPCVLQPCMFHTYSIHIPCVFRTYTVHIQYISRLAAMSQVRPVPGHGHARWPVRDTLALKKGHRHRDSMDIPSMVIPWIIPWLFHGYSMEIPCIFDTHSMYRYSLHIQLSFHPCSIMYVPWIFHAYSIVIPFPLIFHGYSIDIACVFDTIFHGYSMCIPWLCHGYSMDIPWISHA